MKKLPVTQGDEVMACTDPNHGWYIRIGFPCGCAITSMEINGKRVDTTVKEKGIALAAGTAKP